jgi:sensor histidine kinase YesM
VAPDALDAAVPNLLLQPLVENALKHGIAPRAPAGA